MQPYIYCRAHGGDNYSMCDSLVAKLVNSYTCDCEVNFSLSPYYWATCLNLSTAFVPVNLSTMPRYMPGKVYNFQHTNFRLTLVLSQRQSETTHWQESRFETIIFSVCSYSLETHDLTEMKRLLEEEKERNKVLEETPQLEQMRKELEALRLPNATLEKRAVQDPQKETTLKHLRTNPWVTSQVEQFLSQLGDSSSEESEDDDKTKKKSSRGRRHTLKSGKASKLTSRVVNPQLWPHSHLSLSYVSKEKKYDDLTLAEFAAGYAAILQRPTLPPQELSARIVHLSSLIC